MVSGKKNIAIQLSNLKANYSPNFILEQYELDSENSLNFILNILPHSEKKVILDAGCGSGSLTIAAIKLGVNYVISLDLDFNALKNLKYNAKKYNMYQYIDIIQADFLNFYLSRKIDEIMMNPPFGTKIRNMDKKFLIKSFDLSDKIFSLHKERNDKFFIRLAKKNGYSLYKIGTLRYVIKNIFPFHRKKKHVIYLAQYLFLKKHDKE